MLIILKWILHYVNTLFLKKVIYSGYWSNHRYLRLEFNSKCLYLNLRQIMQDWRGSHALKQSNAWTLIILIVLRGQNLLSIANYWRFSVSGMALCLDWSDGQFPWKALGHLLPLLHVHPQESIEFVSFLNWPLHNCLSSRGSSVEVAESGLLFSVTAGC